MGSFISCLRKLINLVARTFKYREVMNAENLFKLQAEGIISGNHDRQMEIAEYSFGHYPFIFLQSATARFYLPLLLTKYNNSYIFFRCSLSKGVDFSFKDCLKKWDGTPYEENTWVFSVRKRDTNVAIHHLGKLKKRNQCLVVELPSKEVLNIPLECKISNETAAKLHLVYHNYSTSFSTAYNHLYGRDGNYWPLYKHPHPKEIPSI